MPFYLLIALLLATALGGGSSRNGTYSVVTATRVIAISGWSTENITSASYFGASFELFVGGFDAHPKANKEFPVTLRFPSGKESNASYVPFMIDNGDQRPYFSETMEVINYDTGALCQALFPYKTRVLTFLCDNFITGYEQLFYRCTAGPCME